MKIKKSVVAVSLLLLITSLPTSVGSKTADVYSLKVFNVFNAKVKKNCAKLVDPKLSECVSKIVDKDPKPEVLKRSILADSGAAILRATAKGVVKDIESLATQRKKSPDKALLQEAVTFIPSGVVSAFYDKKSESIKLAIPLAEAGVVVLVQVANIAVVKGKLVISGKDIFGRSLAVEP